MSSYVIKLSELCNKFFEDIHTIVNQKEYEYGYGVIGTFIENYDINNRHEIMIKTLDVCQKYQLQQKKFELEFEYAIEVGVFNLKWDKDRT